MCSRTHVYVCLYVDVCLIVFSSVSSHLLFVSSTKCVHAVRVLALLVIYAVYNITGRPVVRARGRKNSRLSSLFRPTINNIFHLSYRALKLLTFTYLKIEWEKEEKKISTGFTHTCLFILCRLALEPRVFLYRARKGQFLSASLRALYISFVVSVCIWVCQFTLLFAFFYLYIFVCIIYSIFLSL